MLIWFTLFLNPKYAPMKVKGTDIPNHKANMATKVLNGTEAELPLAQNMRFIIKNKLNTILQYKYDIIHMRNIHT